MREHAFFQKIATREVTNENLNEFLSEEGMKVLFLWGHDCPNCEIAKRSLVEYVAELKAYNLSWVHCNVYESMEVATRFGLHGIPVFLFFNGSKKLGKVTSYPGWEKFEPVLQTITQSQR